MIFTIDSADSRPIYIQIMDEVRRAIVVGSVSSDDPLPSVRQLAATLRVNPNTVSQAYRELERDGVVEVRRGQGTYITNGRATAADRRALARDVAARAVRDAHRNGLDVAELIQAIRSADLQPVKKVARA
ncbi:MAG: GntR family transcriptional regulator [Gemmatimonadota bacterium]|nr:GntR family transcriptional regulator [Gemmatimonadota bacterium]